MEKFIALYFLAILARHNEKGTNENPVRTKEMHLTNLLTTTLNANVLHKPINKEESDKIGKVR